MMAKALSNKSLVTTARYRGWFSSDRYALDPIRLGSTTVAQAGPRRPTYRGGHSTPPPGGSAGLTASLFPSSSLFLFSFLSSLARMVSCPTHKLSAVSVLLKKTVNFTNWVDMYTHEHQHATVFIMNRRMYLSLPLTSEHST